MESTVRGAVALALPSYIRAARDDEEPLSITVLHQDIGKPVVHR